MVGKNEVVNGDGEMVDAELAAVVKICPVDRGTFVKKATRTLRKIKVYIFGVVIQDDQRVC